NPAIQGGNTIIEGGYGGIGTAERPLTLKLHEGATLIARAAEDIHLRELGGNITISQMFGLSNIYLDAQGSIVRAGESPITIQANGIHLVARTGSIGTEDNPLRLLAGPAGSISARAETA